MKRNRILPMAVLCLAAAFAAGEVGAQGRGPSVREIRASKPQEAESPEARARRIGELEAWLKRLHGRFRIRISSASSPPAGSSPMDFTYPEFEGSGNCRAVGAGPGVSCRFEFDSEIGAVAFSLRPMELPALDVRTVQIVPVEILFGLDPDGPGIHMMWVGRAGTVWAASGSLEDNTVKTACISRSCSDLSSIFARPNGERIEITLAAPHFSPPPGWKQVGFVGATTLLLRRLSDEAGKAPDTVPE